MNDHSPTVNGTVIRSAIPQDAPQIVRFIEQLADYERLRNVCYADAQSLMLYVFGDRPYAEVIMADHDAQPAGFALFFHTFSTFECAPSIYLENLFVIPELRGRGIGNSLLQRITEIAVSRQCKRVEWSVLDWNTPAIDFYLKLGAKPMDEWTVYRLDGDALTQAATQKIQ